MSERNQDRPVALVTGGSRGVGAATARQLAAAGYDVAVTYRNKAARAEEVVAQVRAAGGSGLAIGGDMTQSADRGALVEAINSWAGRLDALILNASGGLEREIVATNPDYPMIINRDAQVETLSAFLPLLSAAKDGGVVVFVTSHWAHLYGEVEQLPAYDPVASSKHAGEQALRGRLSELEAAGIRLAVVTGDLIEGTITPKLLERAMPGMTADAKSRAGNLPTTEDMGAAITRAVTEKSLANGETIVIGGALESLPRLG
ncbi:MAG TPA: SDR family oxidoreductase [Thermomicrobiales bacterium]|jgi:NAD(P)-dependent dehydrogenase (short-subunit alcohol dehydrogenase family)|nr:SDR family oxidoreductase [Thermomicrobiales bacterium]